jgi:hypothetical protein
VTSPFIMLKLLLLIRSKIFEIFILVNYKNSIYFISFCYHGFVFFKFLFYLVYNISALMSVLLLSIILLPYCLYDQFVLLII